MALLLYVLLSPKLPKGGGLESELVETLPARIKEKHLQMTMSISPLKGRMVCVTIVLKHEMIGDYICFSESGLMDDFEPMLISLDCRFKIYSSVQRLMENWPT